MTALKYTDSSSGKPSYVTGSGGAIDVNLKNGGISRVFSTLNYKATGAGTGYSIGDLLQQDDEYDVTTNPATFLSTIWRNVTTGATLSSAPSAADITPLSATASSVSVSNFPSSLTGVAQEGTDATGVSQMTGGSGIRGWLSGIYHAITNTLAVSVASLPLPTGAAQDGTDGTGITAPTGAVGIRGWLSGIYKRLGGVSSNTEAATPTAISNTGSVQILAANSSRKMLILENLSSGTIYLTFGGLSAWSGSAPQGLAVGSGSLILDLNVPTGAINASSDVANPTYYIYEGV